MDLKKTINPSDFEVGVIIGRFQTNKLHEGHINLISHVLSNHKKTIILLGVSRVQNTKKNPLDFASRKAMIQKLFPSVMILPIMAHNICGWINNFLKNEGQPQSCVRVHIDFM